MVPNNYKTLYTRQVLSNELQQASVGGALHPATLRAEIQRQYEALPTVEQQFQREMSILNRLRVIQFYLH